MWAAGVVGICFPGLSWCCRQAKSVRDLSTGRRGSADSSAGNYSEIVVNCWGTLEVFNPHFVPSVDKPPRSPTVAAASAAAASSVPTPSIPTPLAALQQKPPFGTAGLWRMYNANEWRAVSAREKNCQQSATTSPVVETNAVYCIT